MLRFDNVSGLGDNVNYHMFWLLFMAAGVPDADIIFSSCGFFFLSIFLLSFFFYPRLISAVPDWMSIILLHGVASVRI